MMSVRIWLRPRFGLALRAFLSRKSGNVGPSMGQDLYCECVHDRGRQAASGSIVGTVYSALGVRVRGDQVLQQVTGFAGGGKNRDAGF